MRYMSLLLLILLTSGCVTRAKHAALQNDLFVLKKRMIDIEHRIDAGRRDLETKNTTGNKRIAETQRGIDALENRLQEITGLLDALKVGVITGRYPGLDADHESVASALSELRVRTDNLAETQQTLLKEFKSLLALYDKRKKVKRSKKRKKIKDLAGLKTAFDRRRYLHVLEDARAVITRTKDEQARLETMYLLAESTFKVGRIRDAALHFNDLVEAGADKKYLRLAKIRLGDCFRYLGDKATARIFYQDLIDNFADSKEAQQAAEKLQAMQK